MPKAANPFVCKICGIDIQKSWSEEYKERNIPQGIDVSIVNSETKKKIKVGVCTTCLIIISAVGFVLSYKNDSFGEILWSYVKSNIPHPIIKHLEDSWNSTVVNSDNFGKKDQTN